MRKLKLFLHFLLLITTTTLLALPNKPPYFTNYISTSSIDTAPYIDSKALTYDQIMNLLEEIEYGEIEKKCSAIQLDQINQFLALLATEGILPDDQEEETSIKEDVEELLEYKENPLQVAFLYGKSHRCLFVPSIFDLDGYETVVPCGWLKKSWKNTKTFIKKHKKAIIIGAIIVVTVSAVTIAVIASSSGAASALAGSAAAMAASNSSDYDCEEDCSPFRFESTMKEEIESFKEKIANENLLSSSPNDTDFSLQSTGKTIGNIWAHQTFDELYNNSPSLAKELQSHIQVPISWNEGEDPAELGSREIDRKFSIDYDCPYSYVTTNSNSKVLPYQIQAEKALDLGYYPEAIRNLDQAISMDPSDSTLYLERAASHFHMGEYDQSLQDFEIFKKSKISEENPLVISAFSAGFAKGLPQGVYESGRGIMVFLSDFVTHPIHTSTQVVEFFSRLAELVKKDEWDIIGKSIAPEIYELVQEWEILPSDRKGELAGYALGKHGMDIMAPGALAKVASKSLKSAKELAAVCKNIKVAEEVLVLEAMTEIGNSTKIAETIQNTRLGIAKNLGFSTYEVAQLEDIGKIGNFAKNIANTEDFSFTNHALLRSVERGISRDSIFDTLTNPLKVKEIKIDNFGRKSQRFIGKNTEVVMNPETKQIVSVNPTSTKKYQKLTRGL